MKITKVDAAVLDTRPQQPQSTPRQRARAELERALGKAITDAHADGRSAYRVRLDEGEKASTVRLAFNRARLNSGLQGVNLLKVGNELFIARRPQTRGRRPAKEEV